MLPDLRTITVQNIPDAIRVMNESSRGMSFEWNLDFLSFIALLRYWDFSLDHSLIGYVEDEAAALVINSADPETREAYTVYWGALPKFRSQRISLALFNTTCKRLREDGYHMLHGVSVPDRPVRRYRFIQAQPERDMLDMETESPILPARDTCLEIRDIQVDDLSRLQLAPGESRHWCQRISFLRNVACYQQFLGAFQGDTLQAYVVALPNSVNTTITDLRAVGTNPAAGYELLRWLHTHQYRPPFSANYVFEQSYAHRVLSSAGFAVKRQFSLLSRDLRATA